MGLSQNSVFLLGFQLQKYVFPYIELLYKFQVLDLY